MSAHTIFGVCFFRQALFHGTTPTQHRCPNMRILRCSSPQRAHESIFDQTHATAKIYSSPGKSQTTISRASYSETKTKRVPEIGIKIEKQAKPSAIIATTLTARKKREKKRTNIEKKGFSKLGSESSSQTRARYSIQHQVEEVMPTQLAQKRSYRFCPPGMFLHTWIYLAIF